MSVVSVVNNVSSASGTSWVNPNNVILEDTVYSTTNETDSLSMIFDFSALPSGKDVVGMVATIKGYSDSSTKPAMVFDMDLYLLGIATKSTPPLTITNTSYTLGSSSDLWGYSTLTTDTLKNVSSTFSIRMSARNSASIDYVSLDVFYENGVSASFNGILLGLVF